MEQRGNITARWVLGWRVRSIPILGLGTWCLMWIPVPYLLGSQWMLCTNLDDVLGDDDQADKHADVGQHGEDGKDTEVPNEDQKPQNGQEGKHVESWIHGGCQIYGLVVVAADGCAINSFYYLRRKRESKRKKTFEHVVDSVLFPESDCSLKVWAKIHSFSFVSFCRGILSQQQKWN